MDLQPALRPTRRSLARLEVALNEVDPMDPEGIRGAHDRADVVAVVESFDGNSHPIEPLVKVASNALASFIHAAP